MYKNITKKEDCEALLINSNFSILNTFKYKKILNDFYKPDKYLFFVEDNDVIPLVLKDNLVSFYGGIHYNEYNYIPKNKELLNNTIKYLTENNLSFRLLSIVNDKYSFLENRYKTFDVPYSTTWIFEDIQNYEENILLGTFSRKKRYKINRILKQKNNYIFKTLEYSEFKGNIDKYLDLHIDYFKSRGLQSGWENKIKLFVNIMDYLNKNENIFIQLLKKGNKDVGIYILTYNNNEMIYIFGGTFDKHDENISMLIYFDLLKNAQKIALNTNIKYLDAMRGSFGYKKKLNFKPKALYALVNDKDWIPSLDKDLNKDEYQEIYKRNFGVFKEEKI